MGMLLDEKESLAVSIIRICAVVHMVSAQPVVNHFVHIIFEYRNLKSKKK